MNNQITKPLLAQQVFAKQKGAVAIFIAVIMVLLIGFLGLAVDGGYLFLQKSRLQNVADATSLSCVIHSSVDACGVLPGPTYSPNYVNTQAKISSLNIYDPTNFIVKTTFPVTCPNPATQRDCAQSVVSTSWNPFFMQIVGNTGVSSSATAIAGSPITNACVVVLNQLDPNGNSNLTANNCTIDVGSIKNGANGTVNSTGVNGKISVYGGGNADCTNCSPAPTLVSSVIKDPLAKSIDNLQSCTDPNPICGNDTPGVCTYKPTTLNGSLTFCNALNLVRNTVFENGTYNLHKGIDNNEFAMTGGYDTSTGKCNSSGNGVFFHIGETGTWKISAKNNDINLCASTNCPPKSNGLLVYQDNTTGVTFNGSKGSGKITYNGIMDFFKATLTLDGSKSGLNVSGTLVANNMVKNGNNVSIISPPNDPCNAEQFPGNIRLLK